MHGEDVARKDFSLSFRGFDQSEVRAYLGQLAREIAALRERDADLTARIAELESAPPPPDVELDEAALEAALGREATRVLHAAREAAAEIRANADAVLAASQAEAEAATAAIRAEVEEALAVLRADTERRATAILEESRSKAAAMVVDATAQRDAMRAEVERLRVARDRLTESFDAVQRALDGAADDDDAVEPAPAEPVVEERAPIVFDPAPMPEPEPEPVAVAVEAEPEPEPEPVVEPAPEPEPEPSYRHSASVRVLRPGGTPVAPEPEDPVEGVRLLEPVPDLVDVLDDDEPEPVAVEPAPEPVPDAEPEPAVEDLFARLRADRADKVASATALLAADARPEPEPEAVVEVEVEVAHEDDAHEDDALEPDLALLAARDDAVADSERALVRSLKRALADEQNEVLDALRRLKGRPTIEGLLPDVAVHDARYEGVLHGAATDAAGAGGSSTSGGTVATALGRAVAGDLRARVLRAMEEAGGDVETLAEALSAAYREWKTARVEPLARDVITAGYAAGTYAASSGMLRWVVDPAEGGCPDCDDNVLAGPTPKGTAFPTGQLHPPAHAGCRCLAVPVS